MRRYFKIDHFLFRFDFDARGDARNIDGPSDARTTACFTFPATKLAPGSTALTPAASARFTRGRRAVGETCLPSRLAWGEPLALGSSRGNAPAAFPELPLQPFIPLQRDGSVRVSFASRFSRAASSFFVTVLRIGSVALTRAD